MNGARTDHNSYEACPQHINGHTPQCLLCEIDTLRGLLREVANCEPLLLGDGVPFSVIVPSDLWSRLAPLRKDEP